MNNSIYIYKNSQQIGPLNEQQIREKLKSGEFTKQDHCWIEGWPEWRLLETLLLTPEPSPQKNAVKRNRKKGKKRLSSIILVLICIFIICGVLVYSFQKGQNNKSDTKKEAAHSLNSKKEKEDKKIDNQTKQILSWDQTVKDISEGVKNYDPRSMGIMAYWICVGLQKIDIQKANELAKKSAELGCPIGDFSLACINNIKKNDSNSFRLAYPKIYLMAQNGDSFAQYIVACYYTFGLGDVEKNNEIAAQWLKKSIKQNQLEAIDLGGLILAKRYGKPQEGLNLYLKAAHRGFPHSMLVLAKAWYVGQGFIIPQSESTIWLVKAADSNYGPALYLWGTENSTNNEKMRELIKKGAELNDSRSLIKLADEYISKDASEKNYEKWSSLLSEALECGTFNGTFLGAEDSDYIKDQMGRLKSYNEEIEKDKNEKLKLAKQLQEKNDLVEKIGTIHGKGPDNCYQIVEPKLLSISSEKRNIDESNIDDKMVIIDPLYGMVQRYWPEKENLFCELEYNSYSWDEPITSKYIFMISVRKKLGPADQIKKSGRFVFEGVPGYKTTDNEISLQLSQEDVAVFIKIYSIFKKWEKNFSDVNEKSQTLKLLEKPFAFVWTGNSAQLATINTYGHGDKIGRKYDSNFVDQIKYCVDQIPSMQNLLRKAQSNMKGNIESSETRIDLLTN